MQDCRVQPYTISFQLLKTPFPQPQAHSFTQDVNQFCSVSQSCLTLCDPMDCGTPDLPVHHQLPELAQTHVHRVRMPSNHLILCHLLLPPSIFPSFGFFSYWSFSISPSNEYSGLISFRINWFDLLAIQGTLKSLLQNHSLKASIAQHSVHIIVQEALVIHNKSFSMFVPNSPHSTQLKTIPLPVVLLLVY